MCGFDPHSGYQNFYAARTRLFLWKNGQGARSVGVKFLAGAICDWYRATPMNKPFPLKKALSFAAISLTAFLSANAGTPEADVYPKPQVAKSQGGAQIDAAKLASSSYSNVPAVKNVLAPALKAAGIKASGTIAISVKKEKEADAVFKKNKIKAVPGAYFLKVSPTKIEIFAKEDDGVFYAAQTLARMIEADGKIAVCEVADWPDVPFRGSVEGFYGRVWSHEARLSQIRFYGKYKMNTYIYGPKDDAFHKNRWRDPYPADEAKKLAELAKFGRENHVYFVWAIHLGASFNQNDKENEYRRMEEKFESLYKLGVRAFAIFFDDFGGADGNFHAEACNRATAWLKKKGDCAPLVLCPNQYNRAWSGGNYLDILGEKLDPSVNVMWTGNSVCHDITDEGIQWINKRIKRKAYIWWNWPVVDYCPTALLLGRTYGLSKENRDRYSGFVSNPMDKPEASKIALFGVGDYCWNVDAFDSETSWKAGIRQLYPKYAGAMQTLANHSSDQGPNGHGYRREESAEFKPVIDKAADELSKGKLSKQTKAKLLDEFEKMQKASKTLIEAVPADNAELWLEIEYWVRTLGETGKFGEATVDFASASGADLKKRTELACIAAKYFASRERTMEAQREHAKEIGAPHQNPSKLAELVVMPFLNKTFKDEWKRLATDFNGGKSASKSRGDGEVLYRAFSDVPQLKNVQANREKNFVMLNRILEQVKLAPGQSIGLSLPEGISANYIHIRLDKADAAKAGTVEVSTDGEKWTKQAMKYNGGNVETRLDPNKKIRFMRFVNRGNKTLDFRIDLFKFDVPEGSKANARGAVFDGDPTSGFLVAGTETFVAPEGTKDALVLTDAPAKNVVVSKEKGTVKVVVKAGKKPTSVFEILWK